MSAPTDYDSRTPTATSPSPLYVAVNEALAMRRRYGATQSDIEYLLGRWRWLHGIPAREHELKIAAYAAVLECPMHALTKVEADGVITAAFEAVDGDAMRGVEMIRTWCIDRGAVTPTQVARLCELFRAKCAAAAAMASPVAAAA